MAAVHDNLYALFSDAGEEGARAAKAELVDRGELEMAAVTYLRGRWLGSGLLVSEPLPTGSKQIRSPVDVDRLGVVAFTQRCIDITVSDVGPITP